MAQTEAEILNSLVPTATVENITFESNRLFTYSKGIAVRVVYSISDVVNQDAIGTWFNQQEYEKYFQIRTRLEYDDIVEEDINTTPEIRYTNLGERIESQNDSNISKFTFEKTYYIDNQPESMNFYVVTSFDISQMEQDFGIDLFNAATRDTQKTEKIEIYKNGQLQYPIQDFRIREEIKKFEFSEQRAEDFKFLEEQVLTKKERDSSFTTDFISDLWITRNAQGEAKFVFIFDAASFFEKRSEYKDIYKRLTSMERYNLINQMQMPSLKIMRKRVEVIQDTNGRTVKDFKDERSLEEIVETAKLPGANGFKKVITDTGSIMQISITGVSDSPLDDNNLMFITGTDYDIANVTDGIYSYGVSIEIVDTTRQLLLRKLSRLSESISLMKKVLAGSIRPEFYDARTDLYTRPLEEIVSDASEIREFKSTKDRARDIYRTFIGRPNVGGKGLQRLGFLRDAQLIADETLRKIGDLLRMDKIKSPKELEVAIEVMNSLLANAASSIGESNDYYEGRSNPSATDARITAKKFYTSPDKLFDSNIPKLEGIEYLSNFRSTTSDAVLREITSLSRDTGEVGLRVIDGAEYIDRVRQEIDKYFPTGTTQVSLPVLEGTPGSSNVSLLGPGSEFLSMSSFMDSDRNLSVFTGLGDTSASEAIVRNDALLNVEGHFPGSPAYIPSGNRPEASYLSRRDVSLEHIFKISTLLDQDTGSTNSSSRTANSPDNSIEPIEEQASATLERQKAFERFIFDKISKEERLDGETLDLSGLPPSDRTAAIESAPNQIISLMQDGPASMEPVFVVTLEFLTKISYLSGFDPDENRLNVSLPRWENLTLDVYNSNADKNLLCKISPSHLPALGIRTTSSRAPIYDAFFIIKPVADFELEMDSQFARNLATLADDQEVIEQQTLPFASSVESNKTNLRRRLAEKVPLLREKRTALARLEARVTDAKRDKSQLLKNQSNYNTPNSIDFDSVTGTDVHNFMKDSAKRLLTHLDNLLYEVELGLVDRRNSLIPEVNQLEIEVDSLREQLRNLEGSNIIRLDLN